ncbi:F-box/LRR-repeat protein At3g58900-like isoform X1 [Silene latifolia]|uniref:F-box/LRR-repeat protein At3g58900-like isoform X1 n=2 Tax=Silene latifolia TaxID=37657 RepID=UPI003D77E2D5
MSVENVAKMQRGIVDRISELPEFILHTILSMLGTKEACRASVLSKRWFAAWSSIPVLDFRPQYIKEFEPRRYDDDMVKRFVGFIDKIMERYITRKYRITELYLMLPEVDGKIESLVDKWITFAVQNQIQKLEIWIISETKYRLPEILFSAKSLKVLAGIGIMLPFYETMGLVSLEYLILSMETVDDDMLQRIVSSCPLVELDITYKNCLNKISLPWMKEVNGGIKSCGSGMMQSSLKASQLQKLKFVCRGDLSKELPWPCNMNVVALKNLRKLELRFVPITDDVISKLSHGLVVLESLVIWKCFMLKCINISSNSLKQLRITDNSGLEKATIDAPKLLEFLCSCEVDTSLSLIQALDHCDAQFYPLCPSLVRAFWFINLKKFLTKANVFKSLEIKRLTFPGIVIEEDQLRNVGTGAPYKLRELKLLNPAKNSLVAFLNGLFWCCHPDVLSMSTDLQAAKLILSILQEKAECCEDPLKSVEVESMECPRLLSHSSVVETRLRLSW